MLQTTIIVLLILWLLGFSFNLGGDLIHTLLVIAIIAFIVRLLSN
ncbi:MAG: lmo0937 family membrane protein [Candidatus Paceibacterota bacterium]